MKNVFIILLVAFVLIQFFPIDKNNPEPTPQLDFLKIKNTPETTATLIRTGCYDCHSNESKYPWYSNVQPVAWFLESHITEARKKLNFSTFATYEPKRQAHKLAEAIDEVESDGMPLDSYVLIHNDAKFNDAQKQEVIKYFKLVEGDIRREHNLPPEVKK